EWTQIPQGGTVEKLCSGPDFAEKAPALAAGKKECGPWGSGPVPPSHGPWALGILRFDPYRQASQLVPAVSGHLGLERWRGEPSLWCDLTEADSQEAGDRTLT